MTVISMVMIDLFCLNGNYTTQAQTRHTFLNASLYSHLNVIPPSHSQLIDSLTSSSAILPLLHNIFYLDTHPLPDSRPS
jgi:hypothetical protein